MAKSKAKAEAFVLDCSVIVAWYLEDEMNPYAEAIEDALAKDNAVVPSLWPLEVGNVLLVGERRKRTSELKVSQFISLLQSLLIHVEDQTTKRAWTDILNLARAHKLSTYDASYLELAMRRGLALATLNDRLKDAARAVGVPFYASS